MVNGTEVTPQTTGTGDAKTSGNSLAGFSIDPAGDSLLILRANLVKRNDGGVKKSGGGPGLATEYGGDGVFTIVVPVSTK